MLWTFYGYFMDILWIFYELPWKPFAIYWSTWPLGRLVLVVSFWLRCPPYGALQANKVCGDGSKLTTNSQFDGVFNRFFHMNRGMSVYKSFCFWRFRAVHSKVWRQLNLKTRLILNHLWQLATSGGACGPRSAAESSCPSHLSCCHGLIKLDATSDVNLNRRYCRFP